MLENAVYVGHELRNTSEECDAIVAATVIASTAVGAVIVVPWVQFYHREGGSQL